MSREDQAAMQDRLALQVDGPGALQRVGGGLGSAFIVIVRTTPQLAAFQTAYAIALIAFVSLAISERRHQAAASQAGTSQQVRTSPT